MPPVLLLLLLGGGVAYALSASSRKYALSNDCERLLVEDFSQNEMQSFVQSLDKLLGRVDAGDAYLRLRADRTPVAPSIVAEIEACQLALQQRGLSMSEATKRCRIIGDTIYVTVDQQSAFEIALYVWQETAGPNCNVIRFHGDILPAGSEMVVVAPDTIIWPTPAAECYFRRLVVGVKLALAEITGNSAWAVTEADLAAAADKCPAAARWGSGGNGALTSGPGRFALPGSVPSNPEATALNFRAMARDLNRGALGADAVISGVVFR